MEPPNWSAALAAEGMQMSEKAFPQGLKPGVSFLRRAARLKPRPFKTRFCGFGLAFAMLASAAALCAQQSKPWEQIPIPKLHDFNPQQPKRIELKNGIVVFLQEDHELPFISGSVMIPGGSREEVDPAKTGLVELYGEAWRTSGTEKMDGDAMDDFLEARAAHIETGGGCGFDRHLLGLAEGRLRPGFCAGDGPAFPPQIQRRRSWNWRSSRWPRELCGATTMKTEIAGRESAKLVYGANSPYTRQPELATIGAVNAGRPAGLARPHPQRQADRRHQRRL